MIFVFDTFGGLCNQFHDINFGINFCITPKIILKFSHFFYKFYKKNI